MKKILFFYCCVTILFCSLQNKAKDFDAHAYAQGNFIQECLAFKILDEYEIDTHGKTILDVGCGTGNITYMLAQTADFIDGIDPSFNMISYAQEHYGNKNNLEFHRTSIEDFTPQKLYDVIVSFFCFHWIKDKKAAFEKVFDSLSQDGIFVATIISASDPIRNDLKTFNEVKNEWAIRYNIPLDEDSSGSFYNSDEEIITFIAQSGLTLQSYKYHTFQTPLKSKDDLKKIYSFWVPYMPFLQHVSHEQKDLFFNEFVERLSVTLEQDDNGNLLYPSFFKIIVAKKEI
jgi:trans-aconitate methyltransferase